MVKVEFLGPINKESIDLDIKNLSELSNILKNDEKISSWLETCAVAVNDTLVFSKNFELKSGDKISWISRAVALAARCLSEPCSSGAPSIPSSPGRLCGATAHARQSSCCWAAKQASSSATKARLALKARHSRRRSYRACAAGSALSIAPAWCRRR